MTRATSRAIGCSPCSAAMWAGPSPPLPMTPLCARSPPAAPPPPHPDAPYVRPFPPGRAPPPLVGACLWLLLQTLGTPWELETDGAILFFEDTHAPPYYVDGTFTHLVHGGNLSAW